MSQPFQSAIHGGAGTILREQMSDELKAEGITEALESRFWLFISSTAVERWCFGCGSGIG